MSVARFIADQRTMHRVPHAVCCAILAVSVSWFYKWVHREPTTDAPDRRRRELDAAVLTFFEASKRTYLRLAAHPRATSSRPAGR